MVEAGRVLVLGASGQLGHDLVARLASEGGPPPIALDRAALDLGDPDGIEPALADHDFDVLVNCAAFTAVDAAESDAQAAFRINAHAPGRLARLCRARGARLVQVSTDYVFDGEASEPYAEADRPAPINVYGASKLMGEALARREWREGTVVVRTASLFGKGPPGSAPKNFVETMLRVGRSEGRLRVVDDVVMSPTSTAHLARGLVRLIGSDAEAGVYHLVNAGRATWYEFARAIVAEAGIDAAVEPIPSSDYPTPARRPSFSVLDGGRARSLGIELPDWRDALRDYLTSDSNG